MIEQVGWSRVAKKQLKPALLTSTNAIKQEVLTGKAKLWSVNQNQLFVVTRMEGSEIVFVAIAGRDLYRAKNELYRLAKNSGALTIRFHTRRPKLLLKPLEGFPLQLVEIRRRIGRNEYIYKVFL